MAASSSTIWRSPVAQRRFIVTTRYSDTDSKNITLSRSRPDRWTRWSNRGDSTCAIPLACSIRRKTTARRGTPFSTDQREEMLQFAQYRPFPFKISRSQELANLLIGIRARAVIDCFRRLVPISNRRSTQKLTTPALPISVFAPLMAYYVLSAFPCAPKPLTCPAIIPLPGGGQIPVEPASARRQPRADMKAVILAGGLGTRISEETVVRPKPMVEIGGKPILWHIMKGYSAARHPRIRRLLRLQGLHDQGVLRQLLPAHVGRHLRHAEQRDGGAPEARRAVARDAGRHRRAHDDRRPAEARAQLRRRCRLLHDLRRRRQRHRHRGARCAFTLGRASSPRSPPSSRRGASARSTCRATRCAASSRSRTATARGSTAASSCSRPRCSTTSRATTRYGSASRSSDSRLRASSGAFLHRGFWQPMDTLRDKTLLEELWQSGKAPWKAWE